MKYKLCPECAQPMLPKGRKREHPDDFCHASGCLLKPTGERTLDSYQSVRAIKPDTPDTGQPGTASGPKRA